MTKRPWKEIERGLSEQPAGTVKPAGEFWPDFEARARLVGQHEPRRIARPALFSIAAASACAMLVLVGLAAHFLWGTWAGPTQNSIISLDVKAPHSAVVIKNDQPDEGTVLWIVDMEVENGA